MIRSLKKKNYRIAQEHITAPKMIAKCLRGQDGDVQKFSWNLDSFKFEAGFEPDPIS
jgi:hypothetical protein